MAEAAWSAIRRHWTPLDILGQVDQMRALLLLAHADQVDPYQYLRDNDPLRRTADAAKTESE